MGNRGDVNIQVRTDGTREAAREFDQLQSRASSAALGIARSFIGPVVSIAALKAGIVDSVRASAEYEQVQVRVRQSGIRNIGVFNEWAREMGRSSGIQKEWIQNQAAVTKSLGASEAMAKRFTEASIETGAAIGRNWMEVQNQLNKTLGGTLGELAELVPEMKSLTREQLTNGEAADFLIKRYGGSASAQKDTLVGSLTAVKNAAHDVQVAFGNMLRVGAGGDTGFLAGIEVRLRIIEEALGGIGRGAPVGGLDYTSPGAPGPNAPSAALAIETLLGSGVRPMPADMAHPIPVVIADNPWDRPISVRDSRRERLQGILAGTGPSPADDSALMDQFKAWEALAERQRAHYDAMSARAQQYGAIAEDAWLAAMDGAQSFGQYVKNLLMRLAAQGVGSAVAGAFSGGGALGLPGIGVLPGVGILGASGTGIGTSTNNPSLNAAAQALGPTIRKRAFRGQS